MSADRATIISTLQEQRATLEARFAALEPEALTTPCTASEDPGGRDWSPRDHLAHLIRVETLFLAMAENTIDGGPPISIAGATRQEKLATVHRDNQQQVEDRRDDAVEQLLADLTTVRSETLAFIETLSDEELSMPIPGAPWGDGTIGGVLMTNAGHEHQHLAWIDGGLAS